MTNTTPARRCNYCQKQADIVLVKQTWISKWGHRQWMSVYAASCREHMTCNNWRAGRPGYYLAWSRWARADFGFGAARVV